MLGEQGLVHIVTNMFRSTYAISSCLDVLGVSSRQITNPISTTTMPPLRMAALSRVSDIPDMCQLLHSPEMKVFGILRCRHVLCVTGAAGFQG